MDNCAVSDEGFKLLLTKQDYIGSLKVLSLQSNQIKYIAYIKSKEFMEEIYNGTKLLPNLNFLDLSYNTSFHPSLDTSKIPCFYNTLIFRLKGKPQTINESFSDL